MTGKDLLSDLKFRESYSKYKKDLGRLETWEEAVDDVMSMHYNKFSSRSNWEMIEPYYRKAKEAYKNMEILASQRNLQFREQHIEKHNTKLYNCFSRETKFVTSNGLKSFLDFKEGEEVVVLTHLGNWKKAVVKFYGKAKLNKITINRNKFNAEIFATSNHRWILNDGTVTENLKVGDNLFRTPQTFKDFDYDSASPFEKLYWCYGMVYGDGTKVKNKGIYKYSMIRLCGKDKNFINRFEECGFKSSTNLSLEGDVMAYTGKYLKTAPNPDVDSVALITAFVSGYLQADGEKNKNISPNKYLTIQSSEQDHIEFIRNCFPIAGVHINSEKDLTGQQTNFGVRPYTISFSLTQGQGTHAPYFKIIDIEQNAKEEDVWCLEVEEDHSFILEGGIPTGNCSVTFIDRPEVFSEIMWVLLCGAGVGYSIEKRFVEKLPHIKERSEENPQIFVIPDSIEGWADSIKILMKSYFEGLPRVIFDYSKIRKRGTLIADEFLAPGPEGLKKSIELIENLLDGLLSNKIQHLSTITVHDIICILADAVISGGVRRSALIAIFDKDDDLMIKSKTGNWFLSHPWRARANNSVKLLKGSFSKEEFDDFKKYIQQFGEPGIIMVDDMDMVANPCVEIAFIPINPETGNSCWSFCNLNEIIGSKCTTEEEFYKACEAASILGTFQASYTNFEYLGEETEQLVRLESLLGVSITGVMNNPHILLDPYVLREGARIVKKTNKIVADLIGIPQAARTTCIKPSGNASVLAKTASGIHPAHARRYFRTVQLNKDTPMAKYLKEFHPEMLEEGVWSATNSDYACYVPIIEDDKTVVRADLNEIDFLNHVETVYQNWVVEGTNYNLGYSKRVTHNVSNTVTVSDWDKTFDHIYDNQNSFCGLSFLHASGDKVYEQAPFSEVMTLQQITSLYGDAAIFASGLIVDALHVFDNNLWNACLMATDRSLKLEGNRTSEVLKKDIIQRIKKFANNYFFGDLDKTINCLKDVHLYHKWVKIERNLKKTPINFDKIHYLDKYLNADELSGAACSGGACEIEF